MTISLSLVESSVVSAGNCSETSGYVLILTSGVVVSSFGLGLDKPGVGILSPAYSSDCGDSSSSTQLFPISRAGLVHLHRPNRFLMRKSQWVREFHI